MKLDYSFVSRFAAFRSFTHAPSVIGIPSYKLLSQTFLVVILLKNDTLSMV